MASDTAQNTAFSDDDALEDILRQFDETIQDFEQGPCCQYEEHLEQLKRRSTPSICDSGIDKLEAKLGDTRELENFIADLDKVLEEM